MRTLRWAVFALAVLVGSTQMSWAKGLHIVEYPIPTSNALASYIAAEPDGNIWFTERNGEKVARITPQGVITEFQPVPAHGAGYGGITTGPDGALWFTEGQGNKIGRLALECSPQQASATNPLPQCR